MDGWIHWVLLQCPRLALVLPDGLLGDECLPLIFFFFPRDQPAANNKTATERNNYAASRRGNTVIYDD